MTYVLYWALVALVYGLMFFINDVDPPKALHYALAALVGGRGLATFMAWQGSRSYDEVCRCVTSPVVVVSRGVYTAC